jgi:hypothetical protein
MVRTLWQTEDQDIVLDILSSFYYLSSALDYSELLVRCQAVPFVVKLMTHSALEVRTIAVSVIQGILSLTSSSTRFRTLSPMRCFAERRVKMASKARALNRVS